MRRIRQHQGHRVGQTDIFGGVEAIRVALYFVQASVPHEEDVTLADPMALVLANAAVSGSGVYRLAGGEASHGRGDDYIATADRATAPPGD